MSKKENQKRLAENVEPFVKDVENLKKKHGISDFKTRIHFIHDSDAEFQHCTVPPCKWCNVFDPATGTSKPVCCKCP